MCCGRDPSAHAPSPGCAGHRGTRAVVVARGKRTIDVVFCFYKSCVQFSGLEIEALNAMIRSGREITRATMMKYIDLRAVARQLGYFEQPSQGITMSRDYAVTYYKSTFRGWPAYYFVWSAIEHIFVPCEALREFAQPYVPNPIIEACGDCYRFAFRMALDYLRQGSPPPPMTIMHGWVRHPPGTILAGQNYAHAWVERGGLVYDWQTIEYKHQPPMTVEAFYAKYQPEHVDTFTPEGLIRWAARADHYGPFGKPWWGRKTDKPRHVR